MKRYFSLNFLFPRDYDQNEFAINGDASAIAMDSQGYVFVPSR